MTVVLDRKQVKLAKQVALGVAVAATGKACLDLLRIFRVAHALWAEDTRLPLKQRPCRKERDLALKRGPKALEPFMGDVSSRPDAIIIGSGIGGLTCAVLLGRAGKRVLVLEQHDIAGGCMHTYAANGYEWDVGIHYVGEVGGPGVHKALLEQLTRGQLQWKRQEDPFDVAYVPRNSEEGCQGRWASFAFVGDVAKNEALLLERFPAEAGSIRAFFRDVRRQSAGVLFIVAKLLPEWLAHVVCRVLDVFTGFYTRLGMSVTEALTRLGVQDPQLRTVLSYCWGDLGNIPATFSYGLQLGLHGHFSKNGGFFPVGGAGAISHALVETVRAQGGEVVVRAPVAQILVERSQAYGVRLASGKELRVAAGGHIVSSATYQTLYDKLLSEREALRVHPLVQPGGCMRQGLATMSLFVGLEQTGAELGIDTIQENAWCYRGTCADEDQPAYLAQTRDQVVRGALPLPGIFVGFPSSKDPAWKEDFPGKSTVTIVSFVNWSWFAPYEDSRVHKRGKEYEVLKEVIGSSMWEFACEVYPQLRRAKIGHFEAGSPLSNNYYIGSSKGEIYGADHNFERYKLSNMLAQRPDVTGIRGLVVSGQDNLCGGFAGALFGGCLGAGTVLGSGLGLWTGLLYSGFKHVPKFTL